MAETVAEFISLLNEMYPNSVNSSTIYTLINNEKRKYWDILSSTGTYLFNLSSGVQDYTLPTNCEFTKIKENGLSVFNTTSTAYTSTNTFENYHYVGQDEEVTGNVFFENYTTSKLSINPIPTNGFLARLTYQKRPDIYATSDSTSIWDLDQDYIDLIRYKVISRIAKMGHSPDVEIANNYEMDAMELERKIRMKQANYKVKTTRKRTSYREGWDY